MIKNGTTRRRRVGSRWSTLFLVAVAALLTSPSTYAAEATEAEALAGKMLDVLGGRANWAGLRNTINGSQQNRASEPTVVYAVITMDFERPRFRIETTAQDLHLMKIRVVNVSG